MPPPTTLPRVIGLPAHRSLLRRGPSARQFGLDPRTALAVDDLSPPLAQMLDELPTDPERAALVARAVRRGADRDVAEDLLRRLHETGVLVDAAARDHGAPRRRATAVAVTGHGPLAVGVAAGLALAGVGTLLLAEGGGPVGAADIGTGLLDTDRGRPRGEALVDAVRRVAPEARAGPGARATPALSVLADAATPDPVVVAELHAARRTHLPVRMRDGIGVVGPLVLPGRTVCLGCLELHRRTRDPGWPAVAAQLLEREGSGEPATASATAALAVAQVLAALDGRVVGPGGPAAAGATLELDLAAGALVRRRWSVHPDCTCGATPPQTCGPPDERVTIMG